MLVESLDERVKNKYKRDEYDYLNSDTLKALLSIVVRDKQNRVIKRYTQKSHSPTANFMNLIGGNTFLQTNYNNFYLEDRQGYIFFNYFSVYPPPSTPTINSKYFSPVTLKTSNGLAYPSNGLDNTDINASSLSTNGYFDTAWMIQAGSGQQSNPFTTYKLALPISNGSGTGQLEYGSLIYPSAIYENGEIAYITFGQPVTNKSSSAVTITEIGLLIARVYLVLMENVPMVYTGNSYVETSYTGYYPQLFNASINSILKGSVTYLNDLDVMLIWYDVLKTPITIPSGSSTNIYLTIAIND